VGSVPLRPAVAGKVWNVPTWSDDSDDSLTDGWLKDGYSGIGCRNLFLAHREFRCDFAKPPFPMSFEPDFGTGLFCLTLAIFRLGASAAGSWRDGWFEMSDRPSRFLDLRRDPSVAAVPKSSVD